MIFKSKNDPPKLGVGKHQALIASHFVHSVLRRESKERGGCNILFKTTASSEQTADLHQEAHSSCSGLS